MSMAKAAMILSVIAIAPRISATMEVGWLRVARMCAETSSLMESPSLTFAEPDWLTEAVLGLLSGDHAKLLVVSSMILITADVDGFYRKLSIFGPVRIVSFVL